MTGAQSYEGKNLVELPTLHHAYLVEREGGAIRCGVCHQRCLIGRGERGFCRVKVNLEGELYTTVYGDLLSCESRPMEIKPFFHLKPGASLMTFSGPSCNLRCPWCQNHAHSQAEPRPLVAEQVAMKELVAATVQAGDAGMCASITEPLMLFEYVLGLFREGFGKKMVCAFVTNGYMTSDALHMLERAGLNALSIDVKGDDALYREHCQAREGDTPVWETVRGALEKGMHVEVVHLVVTGLNDDEERFRELCRKHLEYAGDEVPLHLTAYHPAFNWEAPPTSVQFLEAAHRMARETGIRYVYVGNVPGHALQNTVCPACGETLVERDGGRVLSNRVAEGCCPSCGAAAPFVT